jgi:hypothetical protein
VVERSPTVLQGGFWMRYLRPMRESIRVYPAGDSEVRADHVMWIFGLVFLRLHYRLPLDYREQADMVSS